MSEISKQPTPDDSYEFNEILNRLRAFTKHIMEDEAQPFMVVGALLFQAGCLMALLEEKAMVTKELSALTIEKLILNGRNFYEATPKWQR